MLLNCDQVFDLLQTNGLGAKAQVGYDLTLQGVKRVTGGVITQEKTSIHPYEEVMPMINPAGKPMFRLTRGAYSLTFDQGIKLPNDKTAFIRHRSSIARCGSVITSGIFDPGFEVDQMGAIMIVQEEIFIEKGARVAQVYIFENHPAPRYDGQFQAGRDIK